MDDVDAFVASVMPRLSEEVQALHGGNVGPRMALWSHQEPVTLFGAVLTQRGWNAIEPAFEWLAIHSTRAGPTTTRSSPPESAATSATSRGSNIAWPRRALTRTQGRTSCE